MPNKTIATLSMMLLLGGCTSWGSSPLWPSLNDGATISNAPAAGSIAAEEAKCLMGSEQAKACALNTINELSEMMGTTGEFKRGAAYALVAAGGAAGGAIAFDASRDLLMGLAIGVASVLGLNAVVDSDGQAAVLRTGLQATRCVYGTAVAAETIGDEANERLTEFLTSDASFLDEGTWQALELSTVPFASIGLQIKEAGQVPAKLQLGPAVVEIRALVREGLYDTIPALEGLAQAQRTRSDAMIEAFRRRADEAKDQTQFQLQARAFDSFDDRTRFLAALAVTDAAKAIPETAVERLRAKAEAACKAS
jgi:hypothetical protein